MEFLSSTAIWNVIFWVDDVLHVPVDMFYQKVNLKKFVHQNPE